MKKNFLITTPAWALNKKGHTASYMMKIQAKGKVEAKKIFKNLTGYSGKSFARVIA